MHIGTLDELTRVLQASISPVALVSGVGLLILSMTNRFGRVTDRLRELAPHQAAGDDAGKRAAVQIRILLTRARLLRVAISFAVACVLLASLMVLALFAIAVLELSLQVAVICLFGLSLLCLIVALVFFLSDMNLSLRAVLAELEP